MRIAPYTEVVNGGNVRRRLTNCGKPVVYLHGHIHDDPGPARTLGGLGNLGCLRPDRFIGIPFSVLLYSRRRTENNRWQTAGMFPWTRS